MLTGVTYLGMFTQEQKAEAVKLYLEVGPEEAAKAIGCSKRSIYGWLGEFCIDVKDEKREQRRQETALRHEAKREALREALLDAALLGVASLNPADPKGYQALAIGTATFIDKYRLENGEATGKTETVTLTSGLLESEIQRLENELGKRAPADA